MEYKVDDVVEITGNLTMHGFGIGDVVVLRHYDESRKRWNAENSSENYVIEEKEFKPYVEESAKETQELPMTTPEHYNQGGIEPIEFINSHNLNFNLGNCVKYVCRAEYKGTQEQDLRKAIDYLYFELERISKLIK